MTSPELWVGLILAVVIILSTTANVALRHFSRVRMSELLGEDSTSRIVDRLNDAKHGLLMITSFVRISAILLFMLLMGRMFGVKPTIESYWPYVWIFATTLIVVMVVGVAIPNAWARYASEPFLLAAGPVLLSLNYILYPLTAFQSVVDKLIRRLAGVPDAPEEIVEAEELSKDILDAVTEGEMAGAVHGEDAEMIQSVMKLRSTDVAEIMTPRTEIVAIPDTATLYEIKELIAREGHSRIPVYGENIDDIKGVLYAKDLLRVNESAEFNPLELMRKVPFVPETKRVPDLLQEFREKKVHLAFVLDEYGGTAGLVTVEDIMEEIIGDIADEYEPPEPEPPIRRIDENTIEVDARVHIDELNSELNVELPDDEDYDTVGGFVFSAMGKIPAAGEELSYNNLRFYVLDAEERRINRLRIKVVPEEAPA